MPSDILRWQDLRKTSGFRLTLLLGSIAMVGMLLLLLLVYIFIARDLTHRSDRVLRSEAARLEAVSPNRLSAEVMRYIRSSASGLNYVGLVRADGRVVSGNLSLTGAYPLETPFEVDSLKGISHPLRVLAHRTATGRLLLIGRDIAPLADLRRQIGRILILSALLVLPLLLAAGVMVSISPLRRLNILQGVARKIAAGELAARMPIKGRGDELDLFAATVNQMVEAVEQTVAQVKSVTDAVAHDLRTPLTHVRNQLYRLTRDDTLPLDHLGKVRQSIEDIDFVVDRFAALMRISELESTQRTSGFSTCGLRQLAETVIELYEPLADDKAISLGLDGPAALSVRGDEKLLFEAISNLVDNAIKFTPEGGQVTILVYLRGAKVVLEVRDNGQGVPDALHEAILRRFDRGAASPHLPGSGLGLSIVAAIIHMHRFSLEIVSGDPGFIARIVAPAA